MIIFLLISISSNALLESKKLSKTKKYKVKKLTLSGISFFYNINVSSSSILFNTSFIGNLDINIKCTFFF